MPHVHWLEEPHLNYQKKILSTYDILIPRASSLASRHTAILLAGKFKRTDTVSGFMRIGNAKGIFLLVPQEHAPWSTPTPPADRFGYDLSDQSREEEGMVRKRCGRVSLTVVLPEEI